MLRLGRELMRHRAAVGVLTGVNLKTSVATTRLGWLWWVLDPLVMMWIYYFMVKVVFGRGGENYHLVALTGIVSWQFFAKAVKLTASTLARNRLLLVHTRIPLEVFTVVPVLIQAFFALIGYAIVAIWAGGASVAGLLSVFPVVLVIMIFAFALGGAMSICAVFLPDVEKFLDYGLKAGFFLTPVLYSASQLMEAPGVPDYCKTILSLNPMMWTITELRGALLGMPVPDGAGFFVWLAAGLAAAQMALGFIRLNQQNVMKRM